MTPADFAREIVIPTVEDFRGTMQMPYLEDLTMG